MDDDQLWAPTPARATPSIDLGLPGLTDVREVARGGDSVVYRARQAALHRDVAIKVLLETDPATVARFARELEITVRLGRQHPHIVTVLDTATTAQGHPCLVMDFYDLGSLHDRLRSHGPLPVAEVVAAGTAVADALRFAHRHGVLHRDVKPQNVLVLPTSYVLTDFGIARMADAGHTASLERFSYRHASVQVLDGLDPTPSDDVWSLGSTLFTLLDGRAPFAAPDAADDTALSYLRRVRTGQRRPLVREDVPVALRTLVEACLAPAREDRPPSADAVHAALLALPTETRSWSPEPIAGTATPVRGTRHLAPGTRGGSAPGAHVGTPPAAALAGTQAAPLAPPPVPATLPPLPASPSAPAAAAGATPPAPVPAGPPAHAAYAPAEAAHTAPAPVEFAPDTARTAPAAPGATAPRTTRTAPSAPAAFAPVVTGAPGPTPPSAARPALPPIELPPLQPQDDLDLAPSALSLLSGPTTGPGSTPDDEDTGVRPDAPAPAPFSPAPSSSRSRAAERRTPQRRAWVPVVGFMGGAVLVGSAVGVLVTTFAAKDRTPPASATSTAPTVAPDDGATARSVPTHEGPPPPQTSALYLRYDPDLSPADVTWQDHGDSMDLSWTDPSGGTSRVFVVNVYDTSMLWDVPPGATSTRITDLDPDVRPLCLHVMAIDAAGTSGAASQHGCQRE